MILKSLKIKNFRNFYGDSIEIEFSQQANRPLTVIIGNNTSGKTTLLQIFKWLLYDTFTQDFEYSDKIVNDLALHEADTLEKVEAKVTLQFTDKGTNYLLERKAWAYIGKDGKRNDNNAMEATLGYFNDSGKYVEASDASATIERILPKELHSYFFFNGERAEKMLSNEKEESKLLSSAIKRLLHITSISDAIVHLKKAASTFKKEASKSNSDSLNSLLKERDLLENDKKECYDDLRQAEANKKHITEEWNEVKKLINDNKSTKELTSKLTSLENKLAKNKSDYKSNDKDLSDIISKDGYALYIEKSIDDYISKTNELRKRGELPRGIKGTFIDDLLESKTCICNKSLDPKVDKLAYQAVTGWKEKAGSDEVESKALEINAEVKHLKNRIPQIGQKILDINKQQNSLRQEKRMLENSIKDIKSKLHGRGSENFERLLAKDDDMNDKENAEVIQIGKLQEKLNGDNGIINRLAQKNREVEEASKNKDKNNLALRRLVAANKAAEHL